MYSKIIISRTDNLGDVMLTLPLAGYLKKHFPTAKIGFIGKKYTRALIEESTHIDTFFDKEEILQNPSMLQNWQADVIIYAFPDRSIAALAAKIGIKNRIGTGHRWWHWLYCNHRVNFSRKKSDLHESQLNCKLLKPLGIDKIPTLQELAECYGYHNEATIPQEEKIQIIFHPKSKGSSKEWLATHYYQLAQLLTPAEYEIYITGVAEEGEILRSNTPQLFELPHVIDLTGQLSLNQLMDKIKHSHALIAASTGPLHIAAALGIVAVGIYPPLRPIHPARWQPVGKKAFFLVNEKPNCEDCKKQQDCPCMNAISPETVKTLLSKAGL
ncbi:MAG: lipopolysaccharide heptosyltransferase family protein [Cytophagales bacterium]|nr:MAG: lipopolysaccharide heptosyltransferase family protein [Cytophagales bacterium]